MQNFENQSGPWEGFYLDPGPFKHRMSMVLNITEDEISGSGSDEIGSFQWQGKYDSSNGRCTLIKNYSTHQVLYRGCWDEQGIWGTWQLMMRTGGFHIWPKEVESERFEAVEVIDNVMAE